MGMNARNRNLALVATHVAPVPYYVVGTLRLLVSDPLFYLLGWWYGDGAVRWVENRWDEDRPGAPLGREVLRQGVVPARLLRAEQPHLCAGRVGRYAAGSVPGREHHRDDRPPLPHPLLGDVFSKPIDWFREFVGRYTMFILPITIAIVAVLVWREWRRGTSEVQHLRDLTEEFGEDD